MIPVEHRYTLEVVAQKIFHGKLDKGLGDATDWGIEDIRRATGRPNLHKGTLNICVGDQYREYKLRVDHRLDRTDRSDERDEDLCFERCWLIIAERRIPAVIAQTSRNHHGLNGVFEIMAEWVDGLNPGDAVDVEIRVEPE